jgi:hypothetical protein
MTHATHNKVNYSQNQPEALHYFKPTYSLHTVVLHVNTSSCPVLSSHRSPSRHRQELLSFYILPRFTPIGQSDIGTSTARQT